MEKVLSQKSAELVAASIRIIATGAAEVAVIDGPDGFHSATVMSTRRRWMQRIDQAEQTIVLALSGAFEK